MTRPLGVIEHDASRNDVTDAAVAWLGHVLDHYAVGDYDLSELALLLVDAVEVDHLKYDFDGSSRTFAAQRLRALAAALTAEADERDEVDQ